MSDTCKTNIQTLYRFLSATQGNWRNAFYVKCDACQYMKTASCEECLFIPAADGEPLFIPISDISIMAGYRIDPTECSSQISFYNLDILYQFWFLHETNGRCPILSFFKRTQI